MSEPQHGVFVVRSKVVQPMSQVWYLVVETWEDDPSGEGSEVGRFVNEHFAQHYANWRNTVRDGVYTCPDCESRADGPIDPGCSNCMRDEQS